MKSKLLNELEYMIVYNVNFISVNVFQTKNATCIKALPSSNFLLTNLKCSSHRFSVTYKIFNVFHWKEAVLST